MSETNKSILTHANAAIANGDHEAFLAHCTDDSVWTFVGDQTLKGKEAIRQYLKIAYAQPPKFSLTRLLADGDFLTAIGEIAIKDQSGTTTHSAYCDVWRLRDGKLAELTAFVVQLKREP